MTEPRPDDSHLPPPATADDAAAAADDAAAALHNKPPKGRPVPGEDVAGSLLQSEIDREVAAAFSQAESSATDDADGLDPSDADSAAAAAATDSEARHADREAERIMLEEMRLLEAELAAQQAETLAGVTDAVAVRQLAEELQATGGQLPPEPEEPAPVAELPEPGEAADDGNELQETQPESVEVERSAAERTEPPAATERVPLPPPEDDSEFAPTAEEQAMLEADLADLPSVPEPPAEELPQVDQPAQDGEATVSAEVPDESPEAAPSDEVAAAATETKKKAGKEKKSRRKDKQAAEAGGEAGEDSAEANAASHPPARSLGAVAGDLSLGLLRVIAAALELVDRPFRWIGPDTRDLLGKIAIATFIAALLVAAVVLLRM